MPFSSRLGLAAAVIAALPAAASAQDERRCETYAHIIDRDPNGVNLRSAPAIQSRVIAVIKFANADDEVGVDIAAESNGWFRITGYEHFHADRRVTISGWVHGSRMATRLKIMDEGGKSAERLLEEPSERSKTLLRFHWEAGDGEKPGRLWAELPGGKRELIDFAKIKGAANAVLIACVGSYLKVRVHKYEGWVARSRLCGTPVTTCP